MSRASDGTYTLPAGNPVTTLTTISSTWANNTLSDLATAMTDSLSRSGDGGMSAPLELTNGTAGAPSLTFASETTMGAYRQASGVLGIAVGGADVVEITTAGVEVTGTLTVSGAMVPPGTSASNVGYLGIPQNEQTGNYTLVLADAGKHIYHAAGAGGSDTYTIPANASVAYPIGTAITFINADTSNAVSIAITSDTLRMAGTTLTGTRSLLSHGIATAVKVTSTLWYISGSGLN